MKKVLLVLFVIIITMVSINVSFAASKDDINIASISVLRLPQKSGGVAIRMVIMMDWTNTGAKSSKFSSHYNFSVYQIADDGNVTELEKITGTGNFDKETSAGKQSMYVCSYDLITDKTFRNTSDQVMIVIESKILNDIVMAELYKFKDDEGVLIGSK